MKRLSSRLTRWHRLPHRSTHAVGAAERSGLAPVLWRVNDAQRSAPRRDAMDRLICGPEREAVHGIERVSRAKRDLRVS